MLAPSLVHPSPVPVLIVGGESSFVQRKLTPQLARHGLAVEAHWEWKRKAGAFPESSKVVFILTDMAGHSLNDVAVKEAGRRGLPIIYGGRKWAHNKALLERAGFPFSVSLPLVRPKRGSPVLVPPPPPPEVPLILSPNTQSPVLPLYEQAFTSNPDRSNSEIYAEVVRLAAVAGIHPRKKRDDICAMIRRERGIKAILGPRKKAAVRPLAAAAAPVPEGFAHSRLGHLLPQEPEAPPPTPVKAERESVPLLPSPDFLRWMTTPAVPAAPKSASPDLAAAVALLRGAMAAEGITSLSVNENGVTFRRVVIEEGSFSL